MGKFNFIETEIEDLLIIESTVFGDDRGFFMETYNQAEFAESGFLHRFVQDNHSKSKKGVLRGLHMQVHNPQGKMVRVIKGEVYDVAVDMRCSSSTFGKYKGIVLSEKNKLQFYVPEGFAHGFLVLSDEAEFVYKCTRPYDPSDELGIIYNDRDIGIDWPYPNGMNPLLSKKDIELKNLKEVRKILGI